MNSTFPVDPEALIKSSHLEYKFKELVNLNLKDFDHVNHEIYRKVVKKVKRKYRRQVAANLREKYPRIVSHEVCKDTEDDLIAREKNHQLWLERERFAQIEFKAKLEKQKRDLARSQRKKDEEIRRQKEVNERISNNITHRPHLEEFPVHNPVFLVDFSSMGANANKTCTPFLKTGVCKYSNMCNNSHIVTSTYNQEPLTTLIFPGMYTNMLLGYEVLSVNLESDEALEYEENDILEHFKEFYDDVCGQMKTFGPLRQFLVCSNYEPHLRGNVYVEFEKEKDAQNAYCALNGRYYAGKVVSCFFTHVKNWREAICGSFLCKKCTKGKHCNYLHVFRNPYNEYEYFPVSTHSNSYNHSVKSSSKNTDRIGANKSNSWSSEDEHGETSANKCFSWESDDDRENRTSKKNGKISRSKSNALRNNRSTSRDSRSYNYKESNSHHKKKRDKHRHENRSRSDYSNERRYSSSKKTKKTSHRH